MKTKEKLNALKEEVETLNKKLAELTVEELAQVMGGGSADDIIQQYNKDIQNYLDALINPEERYR